MPTVVELRKKGPPSDAFVKKKIFWPKHAKAQEIEDEMQGNEVGAVRVRKGASINGSKFNDDHLLSLEDSKHSSMVLTN